MRALRWTTIGISALALVACGHKNDSTTTTNTVTNDIAVTETAPAPLAPGQAFANTAASSDAFEIATSQLAATQSKSTAIKHFATAMITAHTDSTAKLKAAAGAASITPDATLTAEQQATLDSLKPLSGADFDKAYSAAQVDAHQKTLDGLKGYAADGDVAQLKDFATKMIPVVTAHLNMAKGLKP